MKAQMYTYVQLDGTILWRKGLCQYLHAGRTDTRKRRLGRLFGSAKRKTQGTDTLAEWGLGRRQRLLHAGTRQPWLSPWGFANEHGVGDEGANPFTDQEPPPVPKSRTERFNWSTCLLEAAKAYFFVVGRIGGPL